MNRRFWCILLVLAALCALLPVAAVASEGTVVSDNAPYAEIEYDYAPEVQCGTIRYIAQIVNGALYCGGYWQEWEWKRIPGLYYGPGSECGTACISMALSYVGVNKTPKDILDYGEGRTYFQDWDDAEVNRLPVTDLYMAMENYINGNGRYSPPVIHLPNYSERGHYVVVIGKIDDETYEVLDPNNCAVTTMTITGTNAKYYVRGVYKNDRIDQLTQWFNPNAAPALIKSVYPSSCVVKVQEQIYAMSLPCSTDMNQESQTLTILKKDQVLNTTQLILNDWGEYWYKIQAPDKTTYYVPAARVEYQQNNPAQVTISGAASPTILEEGDYFSLKGKITAGNSRLTAVAVSVRKGRGTEGEVMTSGRAELNGNVYDLAYSPLDSQVRFGRLTAGEYTYLIEAQYENYYADGDTLCSNVETVILLETNFFVEDAGDQNPPDQPTLQIEIEKDQAYFYWEQVAHTTDYHMLLEKKNAEGDWERLEWTDSLNSGFYRRLAIGNYRAQLIACNENAWDDYSEDWYHTASGAVIFAIKCDHLYADATIVQEATCKDVGVVRYICTLCDESKDERIPILPDHTPGPAATSTTNQVCLVCDALLEKATGIPESEQTEATQPETQPSEPVNAESGNGGAVILILALVVIGGAAGGYFFFRKQHAAILQKTTETEKEETQS